MRAFVILRRRSAYLAAVVAREGAPYKLSPALGAG
jgi:hypothetical protein